MQRMIGEPLFYEESPDCFNFDWITNWRLGAVALKIKCIIGIEIPCTLISSSNGTFLPLCVRMRDAAGTTVPDEIDLVKALLLRKGEQTKNTYALMAVPLMMARIGSLSRIACLGR